MSVTVGGVLPARARTPSARESDAVARVALGSIRSEQRAWIESSREPDAEGRPPDPEGFCDRLLERLFDGDRDAADRFFDWATRAHERPALLHTLAGWHAFRSGREEAAVQALRRAIALDPKDLFSQDLLMRATPEGRAARAETGAWLKDRFCPRPFETFESRSDGRVNTCCDAWMPAWIGRLDAPAADDLWNAPRAQAIRRSILDGDYRYCSRLFCPKIAGRTLRRRAEVEDRRHREILATRSTALERGPSRVLLSHDRSCNLSCPSCREEKIVANKAEQAELDRLTETVLLPLLRDARRVKVTGSGDPFGSRHFRNLLKRLDRDAFPALRLEIQTNGQLLDQRAWTELGLDGLVESIWVSADAATAETYARLRRGGSFDRLLANLEFIAALRRAGAFSFFKLDAVVQLDNLDELPAFVALGRRLGADEIGLQRIRNWGTFTGSAFRAIDVASPDHPRHADLVRTLGDPCFDGPDVDLGNLAGLRRAARAAASVSAGSSPSVG